jgi:hypothetical protein
MNMAHDLKPPAADDWAVLMRRSQMDKAQARFYQAMWYAAGVAWAYDVADEALAAVCEVTLRATGCPPRPPT